MIENPTTYTFRFPQKLKDALKADAERHSRSINQHVIDVLSGYLNGDLVPAAKLLADKGVQRLIQAAVNLQVTGPVDTPYEVKRKVRAKGAS